jgi:proline iminopeptidase
MDLRSYYPPLDAFDSGYLEVSGGHRLYYEQSGRPEGKPALFLHGGPGAGVEDKHRTYFDPEAYRTVLFDQRGAGRSRPHAGLENNTTPDLVRDIERLREHLGIERWLVFGGSWGSTLALAYAEAHPERVSELVLRGIFLGRSSEIRWLYEEGGAGLLFPDLWEEFVAPIPEAERGDLVHAYHRRLVGEERAEREACARAWSVWEGSISRLVADQAEVRKYAEPDFSLAFARIEAHFFVNGCFLDRDGQLLEEVGRLRSIPGVIVQGRYDVVCPLTTAWSLHRAWPGSELVIVPDAGHSASEPGTVDALIRATDRFRP